jgi:8-oxo-dGTP pyrophosphatase MutT (NUDIX family)
MSHEVKLHEAQTAILRELLFMRQAAFAQLQKPTGLTSDHFTFHVNRLLELGFVERPTRGAYGLTTSGKEYANRLDTDERTVERQGKVAVLVVPRRLRSDGGPEYMVQRRLKQPFWGFYCFMTGKLRWGESVTEGAARELYEETGLKADLEVKAIYHKMDYATNGALLEDKHFYVIAAQQPRGDFTEEFEGGENAWFTVAEIRKLDPSFAGMDKVAETVEADGMQFLEKQFEYTMEEY